MAAWLVGLLVVVGAPDPGVGRALRDIPKKGLSVAVGRAGEAPSLLIQADVPRPPASNQKVLTAAAALHKLGRDFAFRTVIARKGDELVVIGDGDPNFSGRFFDGDAATVLRQLARDVKKSGVERVSKLWIDASRFDDEFLHPDWPEDQLDRWYCAPVAALVYNDSCWDIVVEPARVTVLPALVEIPLTNRCRRGTRSLIHIGRTPEGGIEVRGECHAPHTFHLTVKKPVAFFARAFKAALLAEGVPVAGEPVRGKLADTTPLLVYTSTLERTLPVMLTNSQNLYAECLFKRLGDGTFAGGAKAVLAALREMGVPVEGVEPKDGSGLANTNRLTARALYATLNKLRDEALFVDALATPGTGTLRRRYRGVDLRAKTGTIAGVSTLSGYVTGRSGTRYVFVVLCSGHRHARKAQDLVVKALAHD